MGSETGISTGVRMSGLWSDGDVRCWRMPVTMDWLEVTHRRPCEGLLSGNVGAGRDRARRSGDVTTLERSVLGGPVGWSLKAKTGLFGHVGESLLPTSGQPRLEAEFDVIAKLATGSGCVRPWVN
jgi:hypothetical protein